MFHSCADDPGALLAPGEAYHVIELSGCDFLIAVTEEGRLDLNDVFVEDFDQDMSARPEVRWPHLESQSPQRRACLHCRPAGLA